MNKSLQELQELVFNSKDQVDDGTYLKLMDAMKKVYEQSGTNKRINEDRRLEHRRQRASQSRRPLCHITAYIAFCMEKREEFHHEFSQRKRLTGIQKELSNAWSEMSQEERDVYKQKADEENKKHTSQN